MAVAEFEGAPNLEDAAASAGPDVEIAEQTFLQETARECDLGRGLVKELLARLELSEAALQDAVQLLKGVAGAEAAYSKAYKKLGKESLDRGEGPTVKQATEAVCTYTPEVARAYGDFAATVKRDVERIGGSAADLAQEEQELVAESAKLHRDVQSAWDVMNGALQGHRDACAPPEANAKGAASREDPWLTERALAEAHVQLKKALAAYRTRLSEFFDKAKILDGKRVATLHSLLQCNTVAVQALAAKTQQQVDTLTSAVAAVEPETDIAAFEKTLPTIEAPTPEAPESPWEASGHSASAAGDRGVNALLQSVEVRKKGPVLRLGQVTGQWKEGILVLTRSGFVHWCHEQEDLLVPVAGATLSLCSVEVTSPLEFSVTETERLGKLSLVVTPKQRSLSFKARSADECAAWVVALKEAIVESNLESLT